MKHVIEVFKTGNHTDANGNTNTWNDDDLNTIVDLYNNQPEENKHIAPVVIGHPQTDSPAYGWVLSLKRDGNTLLAECDINNEFETAIKNKNYQNVSIALYDNLLLRHIGFLGAVPPAVKGLKKIKFNSNKQFKEYYFREYNMDDSMIKELLNYAQETFSTEVANQLATKIQELKTTIAQKPTEPQQTQTKASVNSEYSEEINNRILILEKENRKLKFDRFFSELISKGVVVKSQEEKLFELSECLQQKPFEFSENGNKVYKDGFELLKSFLTDSPKQVEFNEVAIPRETTNNNTIDDKIKLMFGGN